MQRSHDAISIRLKDLVDLRAQAESFLLPDSGKKALVGTGNTFSPFKSRGLDFQEVRVYQPGDDIRQIDWHITAKYGKPFTKLYTEEKERAIFFVIDLRSPMFFATHGDFKSVISARLAAFMAFVAEQQKNKIGYLILTDDTLLSSGEVSHDTLAPLLDTLVKPSGKGKTASWAEVVRLLGQLLPAGSFTFLFSDFHDWQQTDTDLLAPLAEKNTFVFCSIYDTLEATLPDDTLPFSDGQNTLVVKNQDDKARHKFHEEWNAQQSKLEKMARKYGYGFVSIATDSDYLDLMTRFCFGRGVK